MKNRRKSAETLLGVSSPLAEKVTYKKSDLYKWADDIIDLLKSNLEDEPKLKLAVALEVHTDPAFGALESIAPTRARHRILARFAKEGLLDSVWSLNWDCHLENAMLSAGMDKENPRDDEPWCSAYVTIVAISDLPKAHNNKVFRVHKPHGCARVILDAKRARDRDPTSATDCDERFLIGEKELRDLVPTSTAQLGIYAPLIADINSGHLTIMGWSASEKYFRQLICDHIGRPGGPGIQPEDDFTCIDPEWQVPGHDLLCETFNTTRLKAHVKIVTDSAGMSGDNLMRWINALYALDCLICYADDDDKAELEALQEKIEDERTASKRVLDWFDFFLPTWIRYCWRQGLVQFQLLGQPVDPALFKMGSLEYVIPMILNGRPGDDVRAAARILVTQLEDNSLETYDYETCPGAFKLDQEMTIPLPANIGAKANTLLSDNALRAVWNPSLSMLKTMKVLLVPFVRGELVSDDERRRVKARVAAIQKATHLSDPSRIGVEVLGE
ncbi:MAG: hypothetical protein IH944_02685 [Armatimonadetes bacterium]|nr:hypothetical protein [Armatimonadota bacterium]